MIYSRCAIEGVDTPNHTEPWNSTLVLDAIPMNDYGKLDSCHIYGNNKTLIDCSSWVYDTQYYTSSRGIEWNFVCGRRWMSALTQTVFMAGVVVGSLILGPLCDKFGRKTIFLWASLLQLAFTVLVAFTRDFYFFVAIRFLCGLFAISPFKAAYVMTVELIGESKRALCSSMFQVLCGVGVMLLSVWAYLIDNSFYLQIVYGLHSLILLPHWFLMDESPRWLWAKGRVDESMAIIKRGLEINKSSRTLDSPLMARYKTIYMKSVENLGNQPAGLLDLFKTPNMLKKSFLVFGCFFAVSVVYYGLGLNTHKLNGHPYLMLFISGFVEIPGYLIAMFCVNCVGHRALLSISMIISGFCLLTVIFLHQGSVVATAFAFAGKLVISTAFAVMYKYGSELFPTILRSTSIGFGTMWAGISGALTPLISLLDSFNPKIPNIVFGSLAVLFGTGSLLLPETLGRRLPQTLEDGETFGKGDNCFTNCTGRRLSDSSVDTEKAPEMEPLKKETSDSVKSPEKVTLKEETKDSVKAQEKEPLKQKTKE